ncbi:MAG TPA: hypothetical protein PLU30_04890 [Verrucomicrobiae bacterium]|nr:hypothetical protein [Verrucomicrobiae bacterium]
MRIGVLTILASVLTVTSCALNDGKPTETAAFRPKVIGVEQGAIQNAGAGTEIWNGGPSDGVTNLVRYAVRVSDHSANAMIRVGWDAYETREGEYHFEKMDRHFELCLKHGQKLNIGCFVTSNAGTRQKIDGAFCCYPAYVHEAMQRSGHKDTVNTLWLNKTDHWEPNFENPYFVERYEALLKAFAAYLEQPIAAGGKTVPRKKLVRCIEMRHFGFWGEGAYPKQLIPAGSANLIRIADAYARHFPDIRLVVPTNGMRFSPAYDPLKDYHFHLLALRNRVGLSGTFRDNWGDDEKRYQSIYYAGNRYEKGGVKMYELLRDRWKSAPLVGEPGRWGPTKEGFHPYWGLLEQVRYLHPVMIRNCNVSTGKSATNPTDYSILEDPKALHAFHSMYALIGFRYAITEVRVKRRGGELEVQTDWSNIGLTPTYEAWTVRYALEDETGRTLWSGNSTLDLRTVLPTGQSAATHTDHFQQAPPGGALWVRIVDPDGISPPLALSIEGRRADGAYRLMP